jgi:dTDP-4-dehydrorhamnose 3,5-epimerase
MNVTPTRIPDVLLLDPDVQVDERGFFMETWHRGRFAASGIDCDLVQDNHSRSVQGTLRGLHYQIRQPQGKLVRVTVGEIFDVAVDIRKSSPTFGQWVGAYLSADNKRMLWVPPGFGHGFYVTAGPAEVQYKCSDYYAAAHERCIQWNDPQLAIEWPLNGRPLLSDKDTREAQPLARAECFP